MTNSTMVNKSSEKKVAFITMKLNHVSTRNADKPKLVNCLETLQDGKELDATQIAFLTELHEEEKARKRKYRATMKAKKAQK